MSRCILSKVWWIAVLLGLVFGCMATMLFGGCVNIYTRAPWTDAKIEHVYQSTVSAAGVSTVVAFPQIMSDGHSEPLMIENIFTIPLGLLGLCDAACEAALDTIFLPIDWPLSAYRESHQGSPYGQSGQPAVEQVEKGK